MRKMAWRDGRNDVNELEIDYEREIASLTNPARVWSRGEIHGRPNPTQLHRACMRSESTTTSAMPSTSQPGCTTSIRCMPTVANQRCFAYASAASADAIR